jgi:UDP-3-O-[3-hydroxymyristoyl] glucosamine N-acyltransferase
MIEQRREIAGHLLIGDFVQAIARLAMGPAIHDNHLVAYGLY